MPPRRRFAPQFEPTSPRTAVGTVLPFARDTPTPVNQTLNATAIVNALKRMRESAAEQSALPGLVDPPAAAVPARLRTRGPSPRLTALRQNGLTAMAEQGAALLRQVGQGALSADAAASAFSSALRSSPFSGNATGQLQAGFIKGLGATQNPKQTFRPRIPARPSFAPVQVQPPSVDQNSPALPDQPLVPPRSGDVRAAPAPGSERLPPHAEDDAPVLEGARHPVFFRAAEEGPQPGPAEQQGHVDRTLPDKALRAAIEDLEDLTSNEETVGAAEFGIRFQLGVMPLFDASSRLDTQTFGALAQQAGLNPRDALTIRAVLKATPETRAQVGQTLKDTFADRPAIRDALNAHLETIVEGGGDEAVVQNVVSRLTGIYPWTLADPSKHPAVKGQLGEIAELYQRANRPGSAISDSQILEIGQGILELLPISGEVLSARDAYVAYAAALAALRSGNTATALLQAANGVVSTIGAIPGAGTTVRIGKAVGKAGRILMGLLKGSRRTDLPVTPVPQVPKAAKTDGNDLPLSVTPGLEVVEVKTKRLRSSNAERGTPEFEALNNPKPNTIYKLDNGETFRTNKFGHTEELVYKPVLDKRGRDGRTTAKGKEGADNDEGGHLRACSLGGSCDNYNLVIQDGNFNRSEYFKWEGMIRDNIENIEAVKITLVRRQPSNARPDDVIVEWMVSGEKFSRRFNNQPGG